MDAEKRRSPEPVMGRTQRDGLLVGRSLAEALPFPDVMDFGRGVFESLDGTSDATKFGEGFKPLSPFCGFQHIRGGLLRIYARTIPPM